MFKPTRHRALTLAEVAVSMVIMSVLLGGITSAILIATRALPGSNMPLDRQAAGLKAVETLSADLATAVKVTTATATTIEFTVPDRGHGAAGDETIRYEWTGVAGDPLTRRYNGSSPATVAPSVAAFSMTYSYEAGPVVTLPRLLVVCMNASNPSTAAAAAILEMQSWGFSVQGIDDGCTSAQFTTALATADVVYLLPEVRLAKFSDKSAAFATGAVVAATELYSHFGLAGTSNSANGTTIYLNSSTHPVLAGYSTGLIAYTTSTQPFTYASSIASGANVLALVWFQGSLFAIDWSGALTSGTATGRRIVVPSGGASFDYSTLTAGGERLERNAILWAAAPKCIGRVTLSLQVGTDASSAVKSDIQLVNLPEAP